MKKYEARKKKNGKYGVWNNDMQAFQFIPSWGCNEIGTNSAAVDKANHLNEFNGKKSINK